MVDPDQSDIGVGEPEALKVEVSGRAPGGPREKERQQRNAMLSRAGTGGTRERISRGTPRAAQSHRSRGQDDAVAQVP